MDAFAIHAGDLQDLLNEAGGDASGMWYDGKIIPIIPGGASYKSSNSQGGLTLNCDLSLTVLTSYFGPGFDFDSLTNQFFNYPGQGGDQYSVDSIIKHPNLHQVTILANSSAEGL